MLRYRATSGPVRVLVNGFLLIIDSVGENSGTRLEPYVQPGRNALRLEVGPGVDANVSLQVVLVPEDGGPGEAVLVDLQYPDPRASAGIIEWPFDLPASMPTWSWGQLQPAPPSAEPTLHGFLQALGALILRGPDDDLLRALAYKHTEVGAALGIGKAAMDQGLVGGLARLRSAPDFQVNVAAPADLLPAWSPDRRLVRPLRKNGEEAIVYTGPGKRWRGFEVKLGYNRGAWIVIR